MSSLHKLITQARKERHLSQANLAERLGVTRTACSHGETGRARPQTKLIEKVARLLGIDANWLICGIRARIEPLTKRGEHSGANLVFESRALIPAYSIKKREILPKPVFLSQEQRKLVGDLIKALHS